MRSLKFLYRLVSSLGFGIFMLLLMAVVLAVATGYEADAGAQAVQVKVYKSVWFDMLLYLFMLSLTLATLRLRPFRLHHIGVVVNHFSILLIAVGALLTRHAGFEARLTLAEGDISDRLQSNGYSLSLLQGEDLLESIKLDLDDGQQELQLQDNIQFSNGTQLFLQRFLPAAVAVDTVIAASEGNPAYRLMLSGSGISASHWLLAGDPQRSIMDVGDHLQIEVLTAKNSTQWQESVDNWAEGFTDALLTLSFPELGLRQSFKLASGDTHFDIDDTAWTLVLLKQYKNFSLDANNQPFDRPGESGNPAISFELRAAGFADRYTYFPNMPTFDPLHGKQPNLSRAEVEWQAGNAGMNLLIARDQDGENYRFALSNGGDVRNVNDAVSIDLNTNISQISVVEYLPEAIVDVKIASSSSGRGRAALQLTRGTSNGAGEEVDWLFFNRQISLTTPETLEGAAPEQQLSFERYSLPLGFKVQLLDFVEEKYPGSRQAASYSSLVEITDVAAGTTFTALIAMNKPLKYKGYKFFQSSFERNRGGETSVLTVSRDPGTLLVYAGSILMVVGLIMIYYLKRRLVQVGKRASAKKRKNK
jgi:hypothetical protein